MPNLFVTWFRGRRLILTGPTIAGMYVMWHLPVSQLASSLLAGWPGSVSAGTHLACRAIHSTEGNKDLVF